MQRINVFFLPYLFLAVSETILFLPRRAKRARKDLKAFFDFLAFLFAPLPPSSLFARKVRLDMGETGERKGKK